ncbi:MAG: hypothetical protein WDA18_09550 [Candidatus Ratteibacteria bacterium]|jgi:hypothetical protein
MFEDEGEQPQDSKKPAYEQAHSIEIQRMVTQCAWALKKEMVPIMKEVYVLEWLYQ